MRRQNRCCDQCRKAKRACDAPTMWDRQRFYAKPTISGADGASGEGPSVDSDPLPSSCSSCARTGKNCTFSWARRQQKCDSRSQGSIGTSRNASDAPSSLPYRPQDSPQAFPVAPAQGAVGFETASVPDTSWVATAGLNQNPQGRNAAVYCAPHMDVTAAYSNGLGFPNYPTVEPVIGGFDTEAAIFDAIVMDCSSDPEIHVLTASDDNLNEFPALQAQSFDYNTYQQPIPLSTSCGVSTMTSHNEPQYSQNLGLGSISTNSVAYALSSSTNKSLISYNLMRVYNDSFELALACCLSPEVCPYSLDQTKTYPGNGVSWMPCHYKTLSLSKQYDPKKQDNGVYHAVTKLDKAARASGLVILTKEQDKAVSKALHLTMMAYATQWAQGSSREVEVYPQNLHANLARRASLDDLNTEFDYFLNKTLWMQAKRALDKCANIECFRIACAEWIMGLIQRPMEQIEFSSHRFPTNGPDESVASQITDILSAEGPPVFTEQAARKVHALKIRYDTRQANILDSTTGQKRSSCIGKDDLGTFNLMYWMTVMLDSISSAMCSRPIVVSDSECQHDPEYLQHPQRELYSLEYRPQHLDWWAGVFDQGNSFGSGLQWPCPEETAIKAFIAATPIKVVIFRQASYLQSSLRGNQYGEPVERIISNAMALCRHWNMTYSPFVRTFLDHFEEIPVQLQIWFIHVVSYFYYGTLLFVDLVEVVDFKGVGLEAPTRARQGAGLVGRLRRECVAILSDLARASTNTSTANLHFAIAKQSILPEPWTGMLIRAFAKTAIIQIEAIQNTARHDPMALGATQMSTLVTQCENCIKALYYLGKKSDMARAVRGVLYPALSPYLMQN